MYQITLPIRVKKSTNKFFSLNLNQYRNAHHRTLSAAKNEFTDLVIPLVAHLPKMKKIRIEYYLFVGSRQSCDVANVCSIVDKFFQDVLTKAGVLDDDNYKIVPKVTYDYAGYEKNNGRVEAHIIPLDCETEIPIEEEPIMEIKINEAEIHQGIIMHIESLGFDTEGKTVEIDLQATRGPEGFTAIVDITNGEAPATTRKPKKASTTTHKEQVKREQPIEETTAEPEQEEEAVTPPFKEDSPEEAAKEEVAASDGGLFGNLKRPKND